MDPVAAARAVLAASGTWAPLLVLPVSAIAAAALAGFGALVAWERPKSADEHWTERARRVYPARQVATLAPVVLPLMLGLAARGVAGAAAPVASSLAAAGALVGCALVATAVERRARPSIPAGALLRGLITMWLVLRPIPFVLVATFLLMPWTFDRRGLVVLAAAAALVVALAAGLGLRIALGVGLLWPAGEALRRAVRQAEEAVGRRARAVYECAMTSVFAAALPAVGDLVFSAAAVEHLTRDELAAVAVHELGHLTEPRTVTARRVLAALALLPVVSIIPLVATFGPVVAIAVLGVTLAVVLSVARLARRMEARADEVAHRHDPSPGTYARVLERTYAFNLVPAVMGSRAATHPDLYDRMIAAGVRPDYPRPRRPSSVRALGFACVAVLPLLALDWPRVAESWVGLPVARSSRSSSARRAVELTRRASEREEAGDAPGALALYAAAAEAVPDRVWPALVLENALVRHGRCAEARGLDETVRARLWREPEMRQAAEATRALLAVCRTGSSP